MPALSESGKVAAAIGFYFTVSISLVFLNKILFTGQSSIGAPLFVTWYQCAVSVVCCYILGELGKIVPSLSFFPPFRYDWKVAQKVMPASVAFVGMICFNNLCLQYVEVHFYQVARSLTILCNIAISFFVMGEKTTQKALLACLVVVSGFMLGSVGEAHFSLIGTVFGVTSSMFVALFSIYVKRGLDHVDNNSWRMSLYNNMNATILYVPLLIATGEIDVVAASPLLNDPAWWGMMTVTGCFGFLIGIASFIQIQVTSPLTHNISGTVKACVQSILSVIVFGSTITVMGAGGIVLVVGGSYYYSVVRREEAAKARAAKAAQAEQDRESGIPLKATASGVAPEPLK